MTDTKLGFLAEGGEMGALMRNHDWSASPLGLPHTWPAALRNVVSLMLGSKFPMCAIWGEQLTCLYNDGYVPILGVRHPEALGSPFASVWPEVWKDIEPFIERALAGQATYFDNLPLTIESRGYPEQIWVTFSYSPIRDQRGAVQGMFCAFTETTQQVLAEQRQAFQLALADRLRGLEDAAQIKTVAAELLGQHLQLARVGYAEIDLQRGIVAVENDWADGRVASLAGLTRTTAMFGPTIGEILRAGQTLCVDDVQTDARVTDYAAGYAGIDARAVLAVPLIRAGELTAVLYLHDCAPRRWRAHEIALAEEVAERTWATVERARAEKALQQRLAAESERLRAMFQQAPGFMAILRGPQHVFEFVNAAYLRLIGERDLVGKPARAVLPDAEGQGFFEMLDRVYASGVPIAAHEAPLQIKLTAHDEPVQRYVDFIYQPIVEPDMSVSGIFVEGYDVTERKRAAQALQASEARYRTLIDNISSFVWRTDNQGNLLPGNVAWADFTGQGEAEYVNDGWLAAAHPDDLNALQAAWQAAKAAMVPCQAAYRLRRHDGHYRHVVVTAAPVKLADGSVAEWVGNCTDVTQEKLAEQALREADRRKDEFLAMLAHELRNPLAPISTASQILKMVKTDEPRVKQAGEIIARQVGHMTSLIDDLLDVSRVARGLVTLEQTVLDLGQIVGGAVEQVRPLIEKRRHRLTIQLATERVFVMGDKTRLVQVVANLLNNAAKYTPEGGEILLGVDAHHGRVELCVRDNGIGIAEEMLGAMFDLFMQAKRSADRSQGGLGVGLALVKNLVRLHGGEVVATSEGAGKGSSFTVTLPRVNLKEHAARLHEGATSLQMAPLTLMIVDDNADAAHSLRMLLETHGHQVRVEQQAAAALELAGALCPQALLIDIGLPGIDGYEVARRLRSMPQTAQAVLIALTGYGQERDRDRALASGFNYHLTKPADEAELLHILGEISKAHTIPGEFLGRPKLRTVTGG